MENVIIILGPTASGKTKISIGLAKEINGEIISADSMQVYKFMDIGTAKPDSNEMEGIKHYLINEVSPDEEFNVVKYQEKALKYIEEVLIKGKIPIVVGGTGLYINSLLYNINFSETVSDWNFREELKKEAAEKGNEYLYNRLKEIDPKAVGKIHSNDIKRIIRALEVYEHTKKPISYYQELSRGNPSKYRFIVTGLAMNREKLYERINLRVDDMVEKGLIDEVKRLVDLGYGQNAVAMQGLGYKEILLYLKGEITFGTALDVIKRDTRHYAKRQMTWFRRIDGVMWVDVDSYENDLEIVEKLKEYVASYGIFL